MDNRPHQTTGSDRGRKSGAIHRWLQEVIDHKAPGGVPPFNSHGKPLYRDHIESHRPQFFTFAELESECRKQGDGSPDAGESPILAPKPVRRATVRYPHHASGNQSFREDSGREVFTGMSSAGKKIMATNERIIYLQEGEKIDPSGKSIHSICPGSGGRTRALSRSDAIKRPSSSLVGRHPDLEKSRKVALSSCGEDRPKTARSEKTNHACSNLAPQGLSRSKSRAVHPGQRPKPMASKFVECL